MAGPKSIFWEKGDLFLLIGISSLLLSASFPDFGLGIFAWFGLSPFLFALRRGGILQAGILGFLFGFLFIMGTFSWALRLSQMSLVGFFSGQIVLSLYFALFGFFYRVISRSNGVWMIVGAPAIWVLLEYARSNLSFLSLPWNLLGHSQYHYLPLIQISDLTGVYGISFLIVMANQLLSEVPEFFIREKAAELRNDPKRFSRPTLLISVSIVIAVVVFTLAYGWHRMNLQKSPMHFRVALVQPNLITRDFMPIADQVSQLKEYGRLTREAAQRKPNLIVWPASSLPAPIHSSRLVQDVLKQLTQETGTHILAGGAGIEKFGPSKKAVSPFSNSEFLISPSGKIEAEYHKIKLVPFNEYLPLDEKIWPNWITTLQKSFIPGKEYTLFQISGIKFGTLICWESLFPELFRRFVRDGAQFMVCVTNEGFYGRTAAPYQSQAMSVFRAVENRIAIARSAPTGVSAFIHPNGEIVEKIHDRGGNDLFVSGILVRDIPLINQKTFYTLYGDTFAYSVSGIAVLMFLASLLIRGKPPLD